jgi:hypothetical protein
VITKQDFIDAIARIDERAREVGFGQAIEELGTTADAIKEATDHFLVVNMRALLETVGAYLTAPAGSPEEERASDEMVAAVSSMVCAAMNTGVGAARLDAAREAAS